ncbi:MAG: lysophospholipid acyltransferase family protein [Pseudorhodoplanes sp.]
MSLLKRIMASSGVQKALGLLAAGYLKLVWKTSKFIYDPPDVYERIDPRMPIIMTMWHGQHFMTPFLKRHYHAVKVMISRHRDGEINAIAAETLGVGTIRGSGAHGGDFHRKGGVPAFKAMLETLQKGVNVAMTADVPKVSRVAGLGIIKLARESQRPIYGAAIATSRRIQLDNWDKSAISLPFSRGAIVVTEEIRVPPDADDETMERLRRQVEAALDNATLRAYEIVDQRKDMPGG